MNSAPNQGFRKGIWPTYLHSIIDDKKAALKYSRNKRFDDFTFDELKHLSARALLPEKVALDTAKATVALFHEHWQKNKTNLPLYPHVVEAIDKHIGTGAYYHPCLAGLASLKSVVQSGDLLVLR